MISTNLNALIIEESLFYRNVLHGSLRSLEIDSSFLESGDNIQYILEDKNFHMVFISISKADSEAGLDLVKEIRKLYSDMIIFALTEGQPNELIKSAIHSGVTECLAKPLEFIILKSKLAKFFKTHELERTKPHKILLSEHPKLNVDLDIVIYELAKGGVTFNSPHLIFKDQVIRITAKEVLEYYSKKNYMMFKVKSNWYDRYRESYVHFAELKAA